MNDFIFVYIEDMLVFSKSAKDQVKHFEIVL